MLSKINPGLRSLKRCCCLLARPLTGENAVRAVLYSASLYNVPLLRRWRGFKTLISRDGQSGIDIGNPEPHRSGTASKHIGRAFLAFTRRRFTLI